MKKRLLPVLLMAFVFLSSCSKDEVVDPRNIFEGYYKGNLTIRFPALSINETETTEFDIKKGSSSNVILVDGEKATVSGASFTYDQFSYTDNTSAGTIVLIFNGIGTISGSNLSQSGTVKTVIQGVTYNGTWSSTTIKQ